MKSKNLEKLRTAGFNVPQFIVVRDENDIILDEFSEDIELFAVRSSFSKEDGEELSFAGQFTSILNVKRSEIKDAVSRVKNDTNVSDYTDAMNKEVSGEMKVIIQEMIIPDYAGVIFTQNPQGILNEIVAIVGKGSGDLVVEEKVDVTTYYFNKDDKAYYYETKVKSPVLKSEVFIRLVESSFDIEKLFGGGCDIEFAIKNDEIYFLQVRPISTLKYEKEIVLDNSNIVESYPGVSLPITQDFAKEVYYKVFKSCALLIASKSAVQAIEPHLKEMVASVNGRIYYNINNWYYLLKLLPFSRKIIPIWQKMLGVENSYVPDDCLKLGALDKLITQIRFIKVLHSTPKKMDELNSYFAMKLPEYKRKIIEKNTVDELIILYRELTNAVGERWGITLINDMYTFIATAIAGKNKKARIDQIKGLESALPIIEMTRLKKLLVDKGEDSTEFRGGFDNYIERYGDRGIEELKLESKTFSTNPEMLLSYLKKEEYNDIAFNYSEIKDGFWVKRAKLGMKNREISRMNRSRAFGMARNILLKIGRIYVENGLIEDERDIFWFNLDEIEKVHDKSVICKRKEEYARYKNMPEISRYVFADKIIQKNHGIINEGQKLKGDSVIVGTPCSSGKITGEVLILEKADLLQDTKGKILVTKSTDPGWVFLIQNAAGIISEKGSLLSHTAIVSRELKKPSVVGIARATEIFGNGEVVTIDGETGVIKRGGVSERD